MHISSDSSWLSADPPDKLVCQVLMAVSKEVSKEVSKAVLRGGCNPPQASQTGLPEPLSCIALTGFVLVWVGHLGRLPLA